jgi:hypothetical protein
MKTMKTTLVSFIALSLLGSPLMAGHGVKQQRGSQANSTISVPTNSTIYALTYDQQNTIKFMYEEEKVARDVYLTLYKQYGLSIFSNIAASEQKHMDAVKTLLDKYYLTEVVNEATVGEFVDPNLQTMYNNLVEQGSQSLESALKVGQTIEIVDIEDLVAAIAEANPDAKIIFENLKLGSENHLAAFTRLLEGTYLTRTKKHGRR